MARMRVPVSMVTLIFLVSSTYLGSTDVEAAGFLRIGFYSFTCPRAEGLVKQAVAQALGSNRRTGAGLIRLFFHDCFVEGCDASILLDTPGSEKNAQPNLSVHGYEVIDAAKAEIERVCPGVVSCADIVALAARESIVQLGGPSYIIDYGRRDGTVSSASTANADIPSPFSDADTLINNFGAKGLSAAQMVALSGAHTVGKAQCAVVTGRLYPTVDSTLDPVYANTLKGICPQNGNPSALADLDPTTPSTLDNKYFTNLINHRGLLPSDQTLFTSATTQRQVMINDNAILWRLNFVNAIKAMGRIGVKTGLEGQIRTNCRAIN